MGEWEDDHIYYADREDLRSDFFRRSEPGFLTCRHCGSNKVYWVDGVMKQDHPVHGREVEHFPEFCQRVKGDVNQMFDDLDSP